MLMRGRLSVARLIKVTGHGRLWLWHPGGASRGVQAVHGWQRCGGWHDVDSDVHSVRFPALR